jgi:hypothetical protein
VSDPIENMKIIIRTEDQEKRGLHIRHIWGLNLFGVNKVNGVLDPRVAFLEALCTAYQSAAHVDTVACEQEQPEAFFESSLRDKYVRTPITIYDGTFFEKQEAERFGSFFLPTPAQLLKEHGSDLLLNDAIALYVSNGESEQGSLTALQYLALHPPAFEKIPPPENFRPSQEWWAIRYRNFDTWLKAALQNCEIVVLSSSDGWYLEVYALRKENLDMIEIPLEIAIREIESTSWYRENQDNLYWESEKDLCLKVRVSGIA